MNTLTAEGDRSGVSTPSRKEKAKNKIEAALIKLQKIAQDFDQKTEEQIHNSLFEIRNDLTDTQLQLMGFDNEKNL